MVKHNRTRENSSRKVEFYLTDSSLHWLILFFVFFIIRLLEFLPASGLTEG